jgi:transcriptional regulator with XRE-family HTH domain
MSFVKKRLLETLPDDEGLRYALDEQFLNTYISSQIRVLRESQDMTQTQLAKAAKTGQSKISEMESDYDSWSLRTLRKLARAFGLRLFVTFESWGELIPRMEGFRRENLLRPKIDDDPEINPAADNAKGNLRLMTDYLFDSGQRAGLGNVASSDTQGQKASRSRRPAKQVTPDEVLYGTNSNTPSGGPKLLSTRTDKPAQEGSGPAAHAQAN